MGLTIGLCGRHRSSERGCDAPARSRRAARPRLAPALPLERAPGSPESRSITTSRRRAEGRTSSPWSLGRHLQPVWRALERAFSTCCSTCCPRCPRGLLESLCARAYARVLPCRAHSHSTIHDCEYIRRGCVHTWPVLGRTGLMVSHGADCHAVRWLHTARPPVKELQPTP